MITEYKFTIKGNPITKKNSQQILVNRATGRPFISPSSKYRSYAKDAVFQLVTQSAKQFIDKPIDYPVNVKCHYWMETHRRVDLANLLEGSLDLLVDAGILKDDNCTIAAMYDGSLVDYDKQNPRVEITIRELLPFEE